VFARGDNTRERRSQDARPTMEQPTTWYVCWFLGHHCSPGARLLAAPAVCRVSVAPVSTPAASRHHI